MEGRGKAAELGDRFHLILNIKSIGGPTRRENGKHEVSRCSRKHTWVSFVVQRAAETQMGRLGFPPRASPVPGERQTNEAVFIKCTKQKHSTSHVGFKSASSHVFFFFK